MKKTAENDFNKAVECIVKSDFYNDLNKCLDMVKLLDKNKELQERIDKAIEYIEWLRNIHHKTENIAYTKVVYNTNELLQILHILKGDDKE